MVCPKCGSGDVLVQAVAEQKKRGCLMTLVYIVLLFVATAYGCSHNSLVQNKPMR